MGFSTPKRVWPIADVPSGGGGGGGGGGSDPEYIRLTPAMCTAGRSLGALDSYTASNINLTDDGSATTATIVANVTPGGYPANITRRFSVFWLDTGIKMQDLSSVEIMLQHVGVVGNPTSSSRKPVYGVIIGADYMTASRDTWYPTPEHYATICNYFDASNIYSNTMVDDENMSASGLPTSWAHASYGNIPVYEQAIAGGNPGGQIQFTVRDLLARRLGDGGGGANVTAAARDNSTWLGTGRYWVEDQTLKVGIMIGNKVGNKTYYANEGWTFKVFYKAVKGRLQGRP